MICKLCGQDVKVCNICGKKIKKSLWCGTHGLEHACKRCIQERIYFNGTNPYINAFDPKVRVNGQGVKEVFPQVKKKASGLICKGNVDDGKTHYCPFAEEFGKKLDDLNKRLKKIELEADELDKINREFNYGLHNLKIKFDKVENSHSQLVLDFYRLKDEIDWEKDN